MHSTFSLFVGIALSASLNFGCVSSTSIEEISSRLEGWLGEDADALLRRWGPPHRSHKSDSGKTFFSYGASESGIYSVNNPLSPRAAPSIHSYQSECLVVFTLNDKNQVEDYSWKGHLNKCGAMIPAGPNYVPPKPRTATGTALDNI